MNRLRAFAQSWSAMLWAGWVAALGGALVSFLLLVDRTFCEPLLSVFLPVVTNALFRSALYYAPEQYYWIASYIGGLSALWTLAMLWVVIRAPGESRRIDRALLNRTRRQEARGAPLEP